MIEPSMKVGRARARVERIESEMEERRRKSSTYVLESGEVAEAAPYPIGRAKKPGPGKRREQTPLLRLQIGDMKKRKGRRLLTFDRSL